MSDLLLLGGGALIGALLALLGAGGSILLLPLLVSGLALTMREAVPLSLIVVLLLALMNLVPALRQRRVAWHFGLWMGVPALVGSWIGASWVKAGLISPDQQLLVFALAAATAAALIARPPSILSKSAGSEQRWLLPAQGLGVGLLTGIAGVGGGFAIVPALVLLGRLPMTLATGTSLLVITASSLMALFAQGEWPKDGLRLLIPLLIGGSFGLLLGLRLAPYLPEHRLRQGFAAMLMMSALSSGLEVIRPNNFNREQQVSSVHVGCHSYATIETGLEDISTSSWSTQRIRPHCT